MRDVLGEVTVGLIHLFRGNLDQARDHLAQSINQDEGQRFDVNQLLSILVVAYLDDYSRFLVSFALSASSSGTFVRDALQEGIANYGAPEEVLTDNGTQYRTWRGKSRFTKLCDRIREGLAAFTDRQSQQLGAIDLK